MVGKLLEWLVKNAMGVHLESNRLMSASQHGFRTGRSTQTNLIDIFETVTKWHDEGKSFDVVYLDFRKLFDVTCHGRLLVKLEAVGVEGKVFEWIGDWLRNRLQRVL